MQSSRAKLRFGVFSSIFLAITQGFAATVSTCDEAGLRAALAAGGPVTFACDGTIVLSNAIAIATATSVDASGHDVKLSGGGKVRIFEVGSGASLRLKGLTITDGFTQGADGPTGGPPAQDGRGGAVLVDQGHFHAMDCRFTNNAAVGGNGPFLFPNDPPPWTPGGAARGGAIYVSQGVLRLTNCLFVANNLRGGRGASAPGPTPANTGGEAGGSACATQDSDVIVIDCQVAGNQAKSGEGGTWAGLGAAAAGPGRGGGWQQLGGTALFRQTSFLTNAVVVPDPRAALSPSSGGDAWGGALFVETGTCILEEAVLEGNSARGGRAERGGLSGFGGGGGIFNGGNMELKRCTLRGNSSISGRFFSNGQDSAGGAIQNNGSLIVQGCLIEANTTAVVPESGSGCCVPHVGVPRGGGLWNGGTARLIDSAFVANVAQGMDYVYLGIASGIRGWHAFGGGIFNTAALSGVNVTLAGNVARAGDPNGPAPDGDAFGGGIYQDGGATHLTNVTVALNEAAGGVPAGARLGENFNIASGDFTLVNSIVSHIGSGSNCVGVITDDGHNISSDSSCYFSATGSLNDTDPKLAPLASYGGPTPTMALLEGSPALDSAAAASCPATDQRGHTRPFGPGCDIGAFESSPPYSVVGHITGWVGPLADIHVSSGSLSAPLGPGDNYVINGFVAGTHTVIPSSPTGIFVQSNAVVTLGPDRLVNFHSYRSNAVTLEMNVSPGTHRVVFAGETGRTYRLFGSSALPAWTALQTNTMSSSGIFDLLETDAGSPAHRLFKVESP